MVDTADPTPGVQMVDAWKDVSGKQSGRSPAGPKSMGPVVVPTGVTAMFRKLTAPLWDGDTYRSGIYLLVAFPVGIFYLVLLTTLVSIGLGTLPILVGFFILLGTLGLIRLLAGTERWLVAVLLDRHISDPPRVSRAGGMVSQVKMLATDMVTWRAALWLGLRFPVGIAGLILVVAAVVLPVGMALGPLGEIASDDPTYFGLMTSLFFAALSPFVALASAWVVRAAGHLTGNVAAALLGPSMQERAEKLEARTTVLEQRNELAHELHDSVGHAMTAVTLQAGAAEHVFDQDPEFARQALSDIRDRGEKALGELDRILGQLSDENDAARAPLPGLDRISDLITETRRAGLPVAAVLNGDPAIVPDDIGRTVYRVVQEALTNVMKHAGEVETAVVVDATPFQVEVLIENQRRSLSSPRAFSGGRGLIGLRERVAASGGTMEAGPTDTGGYQVTARLPLRRSF